MVAGCAAIVALVAFLLYRATLLPGFDFGDSASFQVMAGSIDLTPRDGYPLYYALASGFAWLIDDPAHAMNLVSAVEAALACGLFVFVAYELSGSAAASTGAAVLFAGSYTFWSQSIIAEVYALHILLVLATLQALFKWQRTPSTGRLTLFFALYALAFGNHLSMILLAPAYVVFLVWVAPRGWRGLLSGRVLAIAAALALAGASQYLWNLRALWVSPQPPASVLDGLAAFWFDVTKSDWRETMVLQVPAGMTLERARMYVFDVRQQFGTIALAIAGIGAITLARTSAPRAVLLGLVWLVTVVFAFGYNVGDPYVFMLPSHLVVALLTAPGIAAIGRSWRFNQFGGPAAAGIALLAIALARVYREYPAMDRSEDHRPNQTLQALTAGVDDRNGLLLTDMNWQIQNGLTYFGRYVRPEVAYVRAPEVMLYAPALIADNAAAGRDVLATAAAAEQLAAAYGPVLRIQPDARTPVAGIAALARALPAGTRWVLCILRPTREFVVDRTDLEEALQALTGQREIPVGLDDYAMLAGRVGEPLTAATFSARPFRERVNLDGVNVVVRMESWLAFDTIRRMGFGHVIAARTHTQIVERGVSFVAFDEDGAVLRSGYAAGIFAPQKRFIVSAMVDP